MESVWDYPRPPASSPVCAMSASSSPARSWLTPGRALRVLKTSHPPTIYIPRDDARVDLLVPSRRRPTCCEFNVAARYLDALVGARRYEAVSWTYPRPSPGYVALKWGGGGPPAPRQPRGRSPATRQPRGRSRLRDSRGGGPRALGERASPHPAGCLGRRSE
jgi:hypothetical protein